MKINEKLEKFKQVSLHITTLVVSFIVYWLGVSLSFLLWKISTFFKKEEKRSYWVAPEEENDYKSQY